MAGLVIALDGPAASGKSTVGPLVAQRLGYTYFDTGLLYRAVTLLAIRQQVSPNDEPRLAALAADMAFEVRTTPACAAAADATGLCKPARDRRPGGAAGETTTVLLDGEDVTASLRSPAVNRHVSAVSALPQVRAALLEPQRRLAAPGGVVMAGRDIGTVVLPDAHLKLFLTASAEARAQRRYREQRARGEHVTYAAALAALQRRDGLDSSRRNAPLKAAADAMMLDTTCLSVPAVVERVLAAVRRAADQSTATGSEGAGAG